ncbi:MAG: hypothetical protein IPK16_33380 [Anaerolineales bacterium]|nr:hypothetical protein [Anaerolineales bacterium]
MAHTRRTDAILQLDEGLEQSLGANRLREGVTYSWAVLQVACDPYRAPERVNSEVRRFTYTGQ